MLTHTQMTVGISYDMLGLFAVIFVPFGGAMFWLGMVTHKLNSLADDVKDLKKDVKALSIRIESHILSVEAWQESKGVDKKQ